MHITVRESHRGLSRSSEYHFVVEGSKLVHISHYAISRRRIYEDTAEYTVDLNKLRGKKIIEIIASNSGIFCKTYMYPAEDLALDWRQRRIEEQPLSLLNNLEFAHLTYRESRFLQTDWEKYYIPMIEDLRKFFTLLKSASREFLYVGLPRLIACQIESQANYPLSFLIPYSEVARRRSLEALTKEIHQLWLLMHILIELAKLGKLRSVHLNFEQSSYFAIASFVCGNYLCSLWYEFDMNPFTMCRGLLWYRNTSDTLREFYRRVESILRRRGLRRAPLRPDIAILQGGASCDELVRGFRVKMIIECKNWEYEYWAKDIDTQIIPYREIFQPDTMILASLKEVPDHVKKRLGMHEIIVVDKVYPGGEGEKELLSLVKSHLFEQR